ncbi:phosphonate ABC transporter, permease protein PhnE [Enterococcus italicus]|uniref:phosphonate ABC transporter, permease protein PhnE n=1 Tax=Enterococcus italicus TaxID=246144 RepID=UPI002072E269|nr:phosphonate ABC transporter, permease protein PhnE [Enterococcus italicus]MCM6931518.1 phosphonate ABC transporter, permease protein PhnE [Enterococcus italicus]
MNSQTLPKRGGLWKNILWLVIFILSLIVSGDISGVDIPRFLMNAGQMNIIIEKMARPDWSYVSIIIDPILETLQMAIIGTTIGALVAFPFSLFAARNVVHSKWITGVFRFVLNIIRTIPDLMLAALFVAIVGIGPVAGVISLAVFTFGMVSKLFFESIETIDYGPIEAIIASGGSKLDIIRYAVLPQVMSHFLSYLLYAFEINIRASTVLGYIGAGGIGIYLQRSLSQFRYDQTSIIVLVIFAVVLIIDTISNKLRERLI